MKLNEIFGTETPIINREVTPVSHQRNLQRRTVTRNSRIGAGHYADVYPHPHDSATVVKRSQIGILLDKDAYYNYTVYVIKNNLAEDNVHFPRIYKIEITPVDVKDIRKTSPILWSATGEHPAVSLFRIDMEKLYAWDNCFAIELSACAEIMFNLDEFRPVDVKYIREAELGKEASIQIEITSIISRAINGRLSEKYFLDKDLWSAIEQIRKFLLSRPGFGVDMGENNCMYRKLGTGLQLVLTDPVS